MDENNIYDWTSFSLHMYYQVEPTLVYRAWATAEGLASFFIRTATFLTPDGEPRASDALTAANDRYRWAWHHDFQLEGSILAAEPDRHLQFTFGSPMAVAITLYRVADGTLLKLEQTGIPDATAMQRAHSHLNCRSCWTFFLTNLKSVLEHDIDLREKEPHRSDCVGIEFTPRELNN